jgi:hypothetical protein
MCSGMTNCVKLIISNSYKIKNTQVPDRILRHSREEPMESVLDKIVL